MSCFSGRFVLHPLVAGVLAAIFVPSAHSEPVVIVNPSFEDDGPFFAFSGAGAADGLGGAVISGWELTHQRYLDNPDNLFIGGLISGYEAGFVGIDDVLPEPAEGLAYAWMGSDVTGNPLYFSQAVGTVAADTVYTLKVAIGDRVGLEPPTDWEISLYSGEPTTGGMPLARLLSTDGATIPEDGTWAESTLIWDSTGSDFVGSELRIVLGSTTGGVPGQIGFDNVRLDASPSESGVPGDFNNDGNVDGADFVIWQTNFPNNIGLATLGMGDANGDGNVDGADFVVWQTNFPTTAGSASPVPEPASAVLAAVMGIGATVVWRRRRKAA